MATQIYSGIVKFFNEQKGFGFITTDGKDYFVHATGLLDKVTKDEQVEFELVESKRGLKAVKVKKI
jgi:CspA family cold shock protein